MKLRVGVLSLLWLGCAACVAAPARPQAAAKAPQYSVPAKAPALVSKLAFDRFKIGRDRDGWLVGRLRVQEAALEAYIAGPPFHAAPALQAEGEVERLNRQLADTLVYKPDAAELGLQPPIPPRPNEIAALLQAWGLTDAPEDRQIAVGQDWRIGGIAHDPERVSEHMRRWGGGAEAHRLRTAADQRSKGVVLRDVGGVALLAGVLGLFYQLYRSPAPADTWPLLMMGGGVTFGLGGYIPELLGKAGEKEAVDAFNYRVADASAGAVAGPANGELPWAQTATSEDLRQLGYQRLQAHDSAGALKAYEQALAKDPGDAGLRRTVELLRQSQTAPVAK